MPLPAAQAYNPSDDDTPDQSRQPIQSSSAPTPYANLVTSPSGAVNQSTREHPLEQEHEANAQVIIPGTHVQEQHSFNDLSVDSAGDNDSAIGSASEFSSTTSVHSTAYDFVEENGRRYHGYRQGKYLLPNDDVEQDRLDLQHHLFSLTLHEKLYLAPIDNMDGGLHNALDLATGTGTWAIEFACLFPSTQVIGTDLSPIQPLYVPPNCRFEIDDAEDEWTYDFKFDYIHGRSLAACFKSHPPVIRSAFSSLRPGGYIELQDGTFPVRCIDDTMEGTPLEKWCNFVTTGVNVLGQDWSQASRYKTYLEDAGFEDVVEKNFVWPLGQWARGKRMKMLGTLAMENLRGSVHGLSMAVLTKGLGMTTEEIELLLVDVMKDLDSQKIHAYAPVYVVYGRKPLVP